MSPFEKAVTFSLRWEGGYVNDPRDPGGETKFGISKRTYPQLDIANLTEADAIKIYQRDFWDTCKCGQLPSPIALIVFDIAVNQGQPTAGYVLQEALGVLQDGVVGTMTIQAARNKPLKETIEALTGIRCDRYAKLKSAGIYGKGWFRRAAACLMNAIEPL